MFCKNLFFVFVAVLACKSPQKYLPKVNQEQANLFFKSDSKKHLVYSRMSCGCMRDVLLNPSAKLREILSSVAIYADTNTIKPIMPFNSVAQKSIDSVSLDFYNITLVKKVDDKFVIRILASEEILQAEKIIKDWFSE